MNYRIWLSTVLAACLLLLFWLPETAVAQDIDFYKQQVVGYINNSSMIKKLQGFNFSYLRNGLKTGYVRVGSGNYQDAIYHLQEGYAYAFVGKCDADCRDVDFALLNSAGTKIAEDVGSDDTPVVWILVAHTGDYRIRATIPTCNAPVGCYWGVQALFK